MTGDSTTDRGHPNRGMGLAGATSVGVGAIVGGGILALAGVAFANTGASAVVAFALNGVIALITAASFAEMASRFPESGGTYTFARKVLSVEAAFGVGWVVWFASIVAAVLYALGFGAFLDELLDGLWRLGGKSPPAWLVSDLAVRTLAIATTIYLAFGLSRRASGGGKWANIGKLVVFAILIAGGLWAFIGRAGSGSLGTMSPFFAHGGLGLLKAMGFTFIALQGFDLIAAVGGEIRDPRRNIPRAMFLSLGIALAIYVPLLLLVATAGVGAGESIVTASAAGPETIVVRAGQHFLGSFGYWMVIVAGLLSMISALEANLFAASRVALTMARDRTISTRLAVIGGKGGQIPVRAVVATALVTVVILLALPDVAAAGAAASLIFLVTFALAHAIAILVRRRGSSQAARTFRTPFFPWLPITGILLCGGLAVFQGVAVPAAGLVGLGWLGLGGVLFAVLFARRARMVDESNAARDPELVRLRGRSPLVLVPVANPASVPSLIAVADLLSPHEVGRVLLLSVVVPPPRWTPGDDVLFLDDTRNVIGRALATSLARGIPCEALTTVAAKPWEEIRRVIGIHRCESVLLGMSQVSESVTGTPVEKLMSSADCHIVVLRAGPDWSPKSVRRILVPVAGRGGHERLLARFLGALGRHAEPELEFLRVLPPGAGPNAAGRAHRSLRQLAEDQGHAGVETRVVESPDPIETVVERSREADLVILGVHRAGKHRVLGSFTNEVARRTQTPLVIISSGA